jgi:hypothetical protein
MCGVQRTTVTAVMLALKKARLIKYMRGRIEIIDRPGLEKRSCECYAASSGRWPAPEARAKSTAERVDA